MAEVGRGSDPQATKQQSRTQLTLDELWTFYQRRHLAQKAETTQQACQYSWKYLQPSLGSWQIGTITRADINDLHYQMRETPYQANRTLAMLSSMFECGAA